MTSVDQRSASDQVAAAPLAKTTDVIVVGGGIGGLANALALRLAGHRTRVLERSASFGEVGAGLQMAPNATRVLREWGLLDQARDLGVLPRRLVMRDALDGSELTSLDLADVERRYGAPYLVIHRSDLHAVLLQACREAGVELITDVLVTGVDVDDDRATATSEQRRDTGRLLVAADGLGSRLRGRLSADSPVSSDYVAYRGAVPLEDLADVSELALQDVTFYVGPGCHLVQYPLRRGEMFNQVAVFRSPRALAGEEDWGTPDELDHAFRRTCAPVRRALPNLSRDRWWRMYDRLPINRWVDRRLVLSGDSAHPMLQYLAQGACQAIEDAHALAGAVASHTSAIATSVAGSGILGPDWGLALADYEQARSERTARVQTTARAWGELWHCDGTFRAVRNELLRDRDVYDYRHIDWLYGKT